VCAAPSGLLHTVGRRIWHEIDCSTMSALLAHNAWVPPDNTTSTPHATTTPAAGDADAVTQAGEIVGIVLFALLFLAIVLAALRHWCKIPSERRGRRVTVSGIFYFLSLLFVAVRLAWFTLVFLDEKMFVSYSVNIVADMLFFSCFSLIVMHAAENHMRTTVGEGGEFNVVIAR
jgi:hypothetical protein